MIRPITLIAFLLVLTGKLPAQTAVTEIITDFNGYWKSGNASINPIKPNNNHTLLGFVYNGTRYSTGVNNSAMDAHGDPYVNAGFESMSFLSMSGSVNGNTKAALGAMRDGVLNGPSVTPLSNNIASFLSDGTRGLNIGTGVANMPAGNIIFQMDNINTAAIGDGKPDIIVTQIADPSGSTDHYTFTDAAGNPIGNTVNITFSSIAVVGDWTADFYDANVNPMALAAGFTNTDRQLRLWAADFSDFGITAANAGSISRLKINTAGNSDIAFIAYNSASVNAASLPVKLEYFKGTVSGSTHLLEWQTATEQNTRKFVVERSQDGKIFTGIKEVAAAGNSYTQNKYSITDAFFTEGVNYYRLRMVDLDGSTDYSNVVRLSGKSTLSLNIYPNPATSQVHFDFPGTAEDRNLFIYAANGRLVNQIKIASNTSFTDLNTSSFIPGVYIAGLSGAGGNSTLSFVITK